MRVDYMLGATLAEKLDRYSMPASCGCRIWLAGDNGAGYGQIRDPETQRKVLAHRAAWELMHGPVPEGMELDHLCRNRECINPAHLEPVTPAVNIRRGAGPKLLKNRLAAVTHCPQGHPYSGDNLRVKTDKHGVSRRACRECGRASCRARYLSKRGAASE